MISGVAESSGESAAALVSSLPSGAEQDKAATKVVSRWVISDPESAASWVAQFPEGGARAKSMRTLLGSWGRTDPTAAAEFLGGLPEGASRTEAIKSFLLSADYLRPEIAAGWATQIPSEDKRAQYHIEQVAIKWLRSGPSTAQTWLQQTSLTDERKEYVLKKATEN